MKNRILEFAGSVNLRELGGYETRTGQQIRPHKLLRSGDLSGLTKEGQRALVDYGLKYNVDLRSRSEMRTFSDPEMPGVSYHHLPVYQPTGIRASFPRPLTNLFKNHHQFHPASGVGGIYQNVVLDPFSQNTYRQMFKLMLENDKPEQALLFHCSAGQDRTGIAAALIEKLLGVSDHLIRQDYLLSNVVYTSRANQVLTDEQVADYINQMNLTAVDASSITAIFSAIDYFYGSFAAYTKKALKLSAAQVKELRQIYLSPAP